MGGRTIGVPQELARSCRLLSEFPAGRPGQQLRASAVHSSAGERRERVDAEVPPSEGNEVRRDGRQEGIAARKYRRSGGTRPGGPRGGKRGGRRLARPRGTGRTH